VKQTELEDSVTAPDTVTGYTPCEHPSFDSQVKAFERENPIPQSPLKVKEIDFDTLNELRAKATKKATEKPAEKTPEKERHAEKREKEKSPEKDTEAKTKDSEETEEPKRKKKKRYQHKVGFRVID